MDYNVEVFYYSGLFPFVLFYVGCLPPQIPREENFAVGEYAKMNKCRTNLPMTVKTIPQSNCFVFLFFCIPFFIS